MMPPNGFLLAMHPGTAACRLSCTSPWLIVSRFGANGRFVTVSLATGTNRTGRDRASAPTDLVPAATFFGVRFPPTAQGCGFVFTRDLPEGMPIAGRFLPAEGGMRLRGTGRDLRLEARGRILGDATFAQSLLDAAELSREDGMWHLRAARRPWVGEFIEPTLV